MMSLISCKTGIPNSEIKIFKLYGRHIMALKDISLLVLMTHL